MVPVSLAYNAYDPIGGVDLSLSPVIFLHGIGSFKEYWGDIPQNVANATKRRTYSLDARNHGDSTWSDQFNFDLNACDLLHFLNTEKISKSILVGHSMGGITVIKAALMKPHTVEKIVVEDMYAKNVPKQVLDGSAFYCSLALKALETAPQDLDEIGIKKFVMDYIRDNLPKQVQEMRKNRKDAEDKNMLSVKRNQNGRYVFKANLEVIQRAMRDPNSLMMPVTGKYEGQACFIYGKLSPFKVNEEEENIKKHFPNAIFECIEDASHTVHGDCPLEFTDVLLKFIS